MTKIEYKQLMSQVRKYGINSLCDSDADDLASVTIPATKNVDYLECRSVAWSGKNRVVCFQKHRAAVVANRVD